LVFQHWEVPFAATIKSTLKEAAAFVNAIAVPFCKFDVAAYPTIYIFPVIAPGENKIRMRESKARVTQTYHFHKDMVATHWQGLKGFCADSCTCRALYSLTLREGNGGKCTFSSTAVPFCTDMFLSATEVTAIRGQLQKPWRARVDHISELRCVADVSIDRLGPVELGMIENVKRFNTQQERMRLR
jgi:hypothetical protein